MVDADSFPDTIHRYLRLYLKSKQSHVTCMWLHDRGGIFYLSWVIADIKNIVQTYLVCPKWGDWHEEFHIYGYCAAFS